MASTRNLDLLRSIGADHVIDYRQAFTEGGPRYDFILDNVGNHSMSDTGRALTPIGRLQSNGGGHSGGRWIGSIGGVIKALVSSLLVRQQVRPSVKFANRADLMVLGDLVEAGKVTPVIHRTYPLSEIRKALGRAGEGHARGTVVITLRGRSIEAVAPARTMVLADGAA